LWGLFGKVTSDEEGSVFYHFDIKDLMILIEFFFQEYKGLKQLLWVLI